jgi:hypothetical protein
MLPITENYISSLDAQWHTGNSIILSKKQTKQPKSVKSFAISLKIIIMIVSSKITKMNITEIIKTASKISLDNAFKSYANVSTLN